MRKLKYTDEQIEEAVAFNETDDKEILALREKFRSFVKKYDDEIKEELINEGYVSSTDQNKKKKKAKTEISKPKEYNIDGYTVFCIRFVCEKI